MRTHILFISLFTFSIFLLFGCKDQSEDPNLGNPELSRTIKPSSGLPESEIVITGKYFNVDKTNLSVMIGGKEAEIRKITQDSIIVVVPPSLTAGIQNVVIIDKGYTQKDPLEFTVIMAEITGMQAESGEEALVGDKITIKGTNFSYHPALTAWLNGKQIEVFPTGPSSVYVVASTAGIIELKISGAVLKGPTLKVIDPAEIFTQEPWVINSVDALFGKIYNYKGLIGDFTFNKDSTYTHSENGIVSKGKWKLRRTIDAYQNYFVLNLDDTYNDVIKISRDTLSFIKYGFAYKLTPMSKAPVVQEIPNLTYTEILVRAKLWSFCSIPAPSGSTISFGDIIIFLSDGTFTTYSLSSNTNKGKWAIGNVSGKTWLKLTYDGYPANYQYECIEISFNKFEIKDFNGSYYKPRYW